MLLIASGTPAAILRRAFSCNQRMLQPPLTSSDLPTDFVTAVRWKHILLGSKCRAPHRVVTPLISLDHPGEAQGLQGRRTASSRRVQAAKLARLPPPAANTEKLEAFWEQLLVIAKESLGGEFQARLVFFTPRAELPAGVPVDGDPARDYVSGGFLGDGRCGTFRAGSEQPYDICPQPGCEANDSLATRCCRHFAYCIPYSLTAFSNRNKVSTVVASPRMASLQAGVWKAMLAHEMGHAVDFFVFGRHYRLVDHSIPASGVAGALRAIDESQADPEFRADDFANCLFSSQLGAGVCYNSRTTLQMLTALKTCTGSEGGDLPMLHFSHSPLQGSASIKLITSKS